MDVAFLNAQNLDKTQPIALTNLLSNITTRPGSHKGGWTRLLKCQLHNMGFQNVKILDNSDSLSNFGVVIFDLGAEYSGALNMFGGLDEKVFKRLNEIKDFKGAIYSWRHELPDLSVLSGRRTNKSSCEAFKAAPETFLNDVNQVLSKCESFQHAYRTSKVLIGDSHTPSVWTPEFMIERRDGRTLRGMTDKGTIHRIVNTNFRFHGIDIDTVHVHCGAIDVRHHVMREPNGFEYTANLASQLLDRIMQIDEAKLIVTHTVGIEDESRELPKTGYFKGTPFFGSWADRDKCRQIFNAIMDELPKMDHDTQVINFPSYFFDDVGKLKFDVMEVPGSVHLSPAHYRWDLDNNKDRWVHEEGR